MSISKTNSLTSGAPEPEARRDFALALLLAALMAAAALGGALARPTFKSDLTGEQSLESLVPRQFGDWRETPGALQVVNPQAEDLLESLYSEVLNRSYINSEGYRIMLSLAYGSDQRGALQAHKPEVCYPAQGFAIHASEPAIIRTTHGELPARRLLATLKQRHEPVTYWFTIGDKASPSAFGKRLVELRFALTGRIPDGLLFRVSSIDRDAQRAYALQQRFVTDLLHDVSPETRKRLTGLETTEEITARR
jgi:EpsI family protein